MMVLQEDDDHGLCGEPLTWDHPLEHLEPETAPADLVRDARLMTVHLLNDFAILMLEALSDRNDPVRSAMVKLYGVAFGMGLSIADETMSACADRVGVCRAALSKVACNWNAAHDLPPSFHQKSEEAIHSYAQTRRNQVVASSNGNSNGASE